MFVYILKSGDDIYGVFESMDLAKATFGADALRKYGVKTCEWSDYSEHQSTLVTKGLGDVHIRAWEVETPK